MGGSAIEAAKIAGHSDVDMTADYTFVDIERQQQLTRAIQDRLLNTIMLQRIYRRCWPLSTPDAAIPGMLF